MGGLLKAVWLVAKPVVTAVKEPALQFAVLILTKALSRKGKREIDDQRVPPA